MLLDRMLAIEPFDIIRVYDKTSSPEIMDTKMHTTNIWGTRAADGGFA